ncbi:DUF1365 domain-containing protein [Nocardia asteroides NBRC 15531]|uniref:DUF1365 domain-containing protein n=1 Tax=Nocardia asteroides NBRC 15531 TaxID=1110697 RepID=U5E2V5_NOCAS|nr:DUF1365 domain-containing protein [Nocardia asteroides]TLF62547.1 DUF1365 domain-containing protein [Nocardia asteroides NBRC 15531]UGT46762.1 DUF1365 domain-containing protein [Nocardia asteroides]SFN64451.1 hypothetical protein SAMN05444423_111122 [Nocardia asteroides]VEG34386.1 Protein of uncharacterised function (DUF1365) [Nocardia asteroides]GAD81442.1 hypothetical protein NCAST_01_00100 [Nocardia asteroides NBRC 15531]
MTARLIRTDIRHTRLAPTHHAFRYHGHSWLVDLDRMPRLPRWSRPFVSFDAGDHLGERGGSLRAAVDAYLASEGIDLRGGRVLMLAGARSFGYVFDPLTLYWCRDRDGAPVCVIAEVRNTYGGVHRYLLHPDADGCARVGKEFYVSPFNPVAGEYRLRVPEPDDVLRVSITLGTDRPIFVATVTGRCVPATPGAVLRAVLTDPFPSLLVAARIRWQGVRLWARGLPVVPRPVTVPEEAIR